MINTFLFLSITYVSCCWLFGQTEPVEETLASLLKRSKSHQFYGLMGKRAGKISFSWLQDTKHLQELCSVYLVVSVINNAYYHKIQSLI